MRADTMTQRGKAIGELYTLLQEATDSDLRLSLAVAIIELERVEYGTLRHMLGDEYTFDAATKLVGEN